MALFGIVRFYDFACLFSHTTNFPEQKDVVVNSLVLNCRVGSSSGSHCSNFSVSEILWHCCADLYLRTLMSRHSLYLSSNDLMSSWFLASVILLAPRPFLLPINQMALFGTNSILCFGSWISVWQVNHTWQTPGLVCIDSKSMQVQSCLFCGAVQQKFDTSPWSFALILVNK